MTQSAALILAAGKGTRMHSARPKVLQELLGEPMLGYVLEALRPLFAEADGREAIWAVVGHGADEVQAAFPGLAAIRQEQQLGTGHALATALPALRERGATHVLVVNGDVPLITTDIARRFLAEAGDAAIAFASLRLEDAGAYGRVVRKGGDVTAIVEAKDFDATLHGPDTGEVNAGLYLLDVEAVARLLPRIGNNNKSGEYYITDLVALGIADGLSVRGVHCGADESLLGVNSPAELARMEELLRGRIVARLLASGVTLHAPELVRVGPFAEVAPGAEITGPCELYGRSQVAAGARVESHCVLIDSVVRARARIRSFSHLERAEAGEAAVVGPFARLRPGALLEPESHVGNFVELKNARLGPGAKANHLSYLGDAEVGAAANIGAGTITCNYDGVRKHRTSIGVRAFIGSNTALVAPVEVGDGALVGAGSVITRDVPAGDLAVARGRQKNLPRKG
ncbi:bifunctional UDP-N-acetylglucosamine diphosphorylase/glucosamine-1-phosphate N-acetyltransferase GlmU [Desulfovibrio sp.]|uniref:bifunctional UDP-N-acetylglucosamine diphosphorylase/glucosamine-1-phosphate N-acetyltransferase GlmU n=1 Tax=Desulfovibrio sp. TaxID=885 RepID=UPI0023C03E81|nr:bifunctional UDP-N-acetylglucosamine diphosphorylase/glucosamine-1-phosphate N-acetyltransferase GlmU [Desulfovibrio sp.]MDE7242163.1 bifunctional UDP-N-acetylglucosamine diphosphorylase/glucosamine-1-phosphate N-acetyltransferase GlmU [Desulfovibrio sp.]